MGLNAVHRSTPALATLRIEHARGFASLRHLPKMVSPAADSIKKGFRCARRPVPNAPTLLRFDMEILKNF
jgi:hypothetical protein